MQLQCPPPLPHHPVLSKASDSIKASSPPATIKSRPTYHFLLCRSFLSPPPSSFPSRSTTLFCKFTRCPSCKNTRGRRWLGSTSEHVCCGWPHPIQPAGLVLSTVVVLLFKSCTLMESPLHINAGGENLKRLVDEPGVRQYSGILFYGRGKNYLIKWLNWSADHQLGC